MAMQTDATVARVEARVLTLHNPTLATSYGAGKVERQHVFVRVTATSGAWGIGEGSPLPHFTGEYAETIRWAIDNVLGQALAGASALDFAGVQVRLERAMPRNGTAKHALVTAVYDLAGKLTGQPVCNLLGGRLRDRVPTAWGVGIMSPDDTAAEAKRLVGRGCATVKLKVGADPERDIAAVAMTRQAIGPAIPIRCDANTGYHPKDALRVLRGIRDYNVQYLEQPVAAWDLDSLAWLRRQSDVRIAADESLYGTHEAMELIRREAVDVFVVKLIKAQGLYRGRQVMAIAEAAGIQCTLVSPYETSVGAVANLHLAAAAPNVPFACEVGVDLVGDPGSGLRSEGSDALVPDAPGLGVELRTAVFDET
jgi:muconate cycloisomerase